MADYQWKAITPLSESDKAIDLAAMKPLYETWRASKQRLQESSPTQLAEFTKRLVRRLSIETGILERLYDLDRGTTEALVAQGFAEDLISHSSTNLAPATLIDILQDQQSAIELVIDCVAKKRDLTKGVMNELHAILTKHQDTTTAVDPLGNRREIALRKGAFKEQPNNTRRPDGTMHGYCPPLNVDSEIENLLGWLKSYYADEDPIIVASWFHHRFTQIHPYQDGNGRVARALTTLILLRADLLPLVVDRDLRTEYITSLEKADQGDLTPLANIFAGLERGAILQALSVDADAEIAHQKSLTSAVIGNLAERFNRRRTTKLAELRRVNDVAIRLRDVARATCEDALRQLEATVREIAEADLFSQNGGSDHGTAHWYKFDVGRSAKEAGKFANFAENHYFTKSSMRVERERLVFVVSFHHVGRELSGIMEATAFSRLESFEDSEDRESVSDKFMPCSIEPFVFTYKTDADGVKDAFLRWLDAALAIAIKGFGDRL